MKYVNQGIPKVDYEALVTWQGVYVNDLAPTDCLVVKVLRSPHAHALIEEVNLNRAKAVPGLKLFLHIRIVRIRDLRWRGRLILNRVRMIA